MNKQVNSLYRIYRPKIFTDVVGQQHVTMTLQNQIAGGKVNHAYLFCGTRGTGKTTVAKIFAREVNKSVSGDSLSGACSPLKSIKAPEGGFPDTLDIFEIDAASNNSVQDVRDLIDKVKYPPVTAKYKVYIIDEVHMFSGAAFNAFLKTLEEPPSHVIFILCTTEPHKLLPTVQSRCLRFDFRTAPIADIKKVLEKIFKTEKVTIEPEALQLLAEAGAGSFRDALSFAETVIAFCGEKQITAAAVCEVIGTIDKKLLRELLEAIVKNDIDKIMKNTETIFSRGLNANVLVKDFLDVIRVSFVETKNAQLLNIYKTFAELEINIKTTQDAKSMFEGACLICLTPR